MASRGALALHMAFWLRDAYRLYNVVTDGILRFICAKNGVLLGRPDARRRFFIVVSNSIQRLTCCYCGVFWNHRFSSIVSSSTPRFMCTKYGVLWRRRLSYSCPLASLGPSAQENCLVAASRQLASRRSASISVVVSSGIRRLTYCYCGVFSRRREALPPFSSVVSDGIRGSSVPNMVLRRRREAPRRFSYSSIGVPWPICAENGLVPALVFQLLVCWHSLYGVF